MRDYRHYAHIRERDARRNAQDARDAALHARFDATKDEIRMKYERASFAVVTASEAFREGWDRIFTSPQAARAPGNVPADEAAKESA